jgi:hypothetical protein
MLRLHTRPRNQDPLLVLHITFRDVISPDPLSGAILETTPAVASRVPIPRRNVFHLTRRPSSIATDWPSQHQTAAVAHSRTRGFEIAKRSGRPRAIGEKRGDGQSPGKIHGQARTDQAINFYCSYVGVNIHGPHFAPSKRRAWTLALVSPWGSPSPAGLVMRRNRSLSSKRCPNKRKKNGDNQFSILKGADRRG